MVKLLKTMIFFGCLWLPFSGFGQLRTATTDGAWTTATNWTGSNVADVITEDAQLNNDVDLTHTTTTLTVGNINMTDRSTLTLSSSGIINVGASGTAKSITAATDNRIDIQSGSSMVIWGDLNATDRVDLVVAGDLTIKGALNFTSDGQLTVSGTLTVDGDFGISDRASINITGTTIVKGDFTGGFDNSFNVGGTFNIFGDATFSDRATAGGSGAIGVGGTCSDGGGGNFCTFVSVLPIELLSFSAKDSKDGIIITWSTAMEKDNSHFEVQRSFDGRNYETIDKVAGSGNSSQVLEYTYVDGLNYTGLVYYRLKQVDFNGDNETFRPVSVELNSNFKEAFFFFDQGSELVLNHNLGNVKTFELEVLDISGNKLFATNQITNNRIALDGLNLYTGVYIIKAKVNHFPFIQKVLFRK